MDWKYIHRYPYGPNELYYLEKDPQEQNNLIAEESCKEQVHKMKKMLDDWFITYADPNIDGTKEAVKGAGQFDLAGGTDVYSEWDDSAQ